VSSGSKIPLGQIKQEHRQQAEGHGREHQGPQPISVSSPRCLLRIYAAAPFPPHSGPIAVKKLNAGEFEGGPHGRKLFGRQNRLTTLEVPNSIFWKIGAHGQLDDGPVKQAAGRAGLFGLEGHL
jgi:hypothetical protein